MVQAMMAPRWLSETTLVRAAKSAAALLAVAFARTVSEIASFPTEPKVSGGIDFDKPIPSTIFWSPWWAPIVLTILFAYWTWPKRYDRGPVRTALSGSFAALRIQIGSVLVTFLCPAIGALYLLLPTTFPVEIPAIIGSTFLTVLRAALFYCVFFSIPILTGSVLFGGGMALVVRLVHGRLAPPSAHEQAQASTTTGNEKTTRNASSATSLAFKLVALTTAAAIVLAGLKLAGFFIFSLWAFNFFSVALPCLALGAAIGLFTPQWAWCLAASLPIGVALSKTHASPAGLITQYSLDFPPVLLAVLAGFAIARKLRRGMISLYGKVRP